MRTLILSVLFSAFSLPAYSNAPDDPNMPRAGLYKFEMKGESQHDSLKANIKTESNSSGKYNQTTKANGKVHTMNFPEAGGEEVCIDYTKKGNDAAMKKMMANCKQGKSVRNGNTTTGSSVCSGIKTVVTHTKVSDNVYETRSETDMRGTKHKSHTVMTRVGDCKL